MKLWNELRRRHVVRIIVVYAAAAWLVLQLASIVFPALHFPSWALVLLIGLIALGFPVAVVLAWVFEWTPSGLRRTVTADGESPRSDAEHRSIGQILNMTLIVLLVAAVGVLGWRLSQRGVSSRVVKSSEPGNSIAVLPFLDFSPHGNQEYFADGVAEQLLDILAQATDLKVVARTSAFQFRGKAEDVRKIGKALDVRHVLEGSVLRDGNQVRISVQLIDAATGYHEWSHTYQRTLGDIFRVQDEITRAIAVALEARIVGHDAIAQADPPANTDAYDEYLLGRHLADRRTAKSFRDALEHFKKAIAIDPAYGPAYAQIALLYPQLERGGFGTYTREDAFKFAQPYLEKAVAIAPDSPDTQMAQGLYLLGTSTRQEQALSHFEKAARINPSDSDAIRHKANLLTALGRYREAWAALSAGARRDPVNLALNASYFQGLLDRNELGQAKSLARRFLAVDVAQARLMSGQVAGARGDRASQMREYLQAWSARPGWRPLRHVLHELLGDAGLYADAGDVFGGHDFGLSAAFAGDEHSALKELETNLAQHKGQPMMQMFASRINMLLGRRDAAREDFHRAWNHVVDLKADPYTAFNKVDILNYAALLSEAGEGQKALTLLKPLRARIEAEHNRAASSGIVLNGRYIFHLAQADLIEGRKRSGLERLAQAANLAEARHTFLAWQLWPVVLRESPTFDSVRHDPRFESIVSQMEVRQKHVRDQILPVLCNWHYPNDGWHPLPETCKGVPKATIAASG